MQHLISELTRLDVVESCKIGFKSGIIFSRQEFKCIGA